MKGEKFLNLEKYKFLKPYFLLLPALIVLIGLFLGGVISALAQSFGYFPLIGLKKFTLNYFYEVWTDPQFLSALKFSIYTSLLSSMLAVIIGVFLAYQLLKLAKDNSFISAIYKLPIIVPYLAAILLIFLLFTQSGILARILYKLSIINDMNEFPRLIFDKYGVGIILTYIWKQIPFVTLVVLTVLKNINSCWEEVASNLGASGWQIFWHIYIPLSMPSIASAFIIIFAFSFGAFEVPYLLGPTFPRTLPVLAFQRYNSLDLSNRPYSMVIAVTLAAVSLVLILIYKKLIKLSDI